MADLGIKLNNLVNAVNALDKIYIETDIETPDNVLEQLSNIKSYTMELLSDLYEMTDVQPIDRWISVDEALPIYDGLVLAIDKNNTVRLCIYTEFGWLSQYGNPLMAHITHWQPLPEPPKDGEQNDA